MSSLKPHTISYNDCVNAEYPANSLAFALEQVRSSVQAPLERTESAHLAVVTKTEWTILKQHVSMEDVRKLAAKQGLEKGSFRPVCLKKVSSEMPKGKVESFYVEGLSPRFLQFRRELWRLYLAQGGKAEDFAWKRWKPYVLVGTTNQLLHDEDQPHREKDVPCLTEIKRSK